MAGTYIRPGKITGKKGMTPKDIQGMKNDAPDISYLDKDDMGKDEKQIMRDLE